MIETIGAILFVLYLIFLFVAKLYEIYKARGYWFKFTFKTIVAIAGIFFMFVFGVIDLYAIVWCITGEFS